MTWPTTPGDPSGQAEPHCKAKNRVPRLTRT
jgi:hypothetical protein